jgi:hypothetical protein
METLEYHILPVVRSAISRLAVIARYTLFFCAGLALLEPVLLMLRLPLAGILSGMASTFLLHTALCLLVILLSWSHTVLLAGQGTVVTRWLMWVGAILSPLAPVCWCYTLVTGKLLLYRQRELVIIMKGQSMNLTLICITYKEIQDLGSVRTLRTPLTGEFHDTYLTLKT